MRTLMIAVFAVLETLQVMDWGESGSRWTEAAVEDSEEEDESSAEESENYDSE